MSLPTMQYLPAWTNAYSYSVEPATVRTQVAGCAKSQRQRSHRRVVIADVNLRLLGAQLPYFEWFVRGICNDGAGKFNGQYIDGGGLQNVVMRIVGGKYDVATNLRVHTVSCQIEIFR